MSTNTHAANQWIKRLPFAVILLAVALTLSLVFANIQPVVRFGSVGTVNESSIQRGIEADAARYTAMANAYLAQKEAVQRGIEADAARYTAMANAYLAQKEADQRGIQADAARYTALANVYIAQQEASLRGIKAETARYEAMATFYSTWISGSVQPTGMAEYFYAGK